MAAASADTVVETGTSTKCPLCGGAYKTVLQHLRRANKCKSLSDYTAELMKSFNTEQMLFITTPIHSKDQVGTTRPVDIKLLGVPGGGKTKVIITKCCYLMVQGIVNKSTDFLILTFSRRAMDDFIAKSKNSGFPIFNNKNIRTLHSLAGSFMKTECDMNSASITTVIVSALYQLKNNQDINLRKIPALSDCKFIIVDEAQDISKVQYEFINSIKQKLNIPLILVGDPNQSIYQFQGGSDEFLVEHPGQQISLINNYRSTNEIIAFTNYLRPRAGLPLIISATNKTGPKPIIIQAKTDDLHRAFLQEVLDKKYKLEEIAILSPVKKAKTKYENMFLNLGAMLAINWLNNANIPYNAFFTMDKDDVASDLGLSFERVPGRVVIGTAHSSKGLEFKKIILLNFHFRTFGRKPDIKQYNEFKYLWYVATTRAQEALVILADSNNELWPAVSEIPESIYEFRGTKSVSNGIPDKATKELYYNITQLINDPQKFTVERYFQLEQIARFRYNQSTLFDVNEVLNSSIADITAAISSMTLTDSEPGAAAAASITPQIIKENATTEQEILLKKIDFQHYSAFYGMFMEQIFEMFYETNHNNIDKYINKWNEYIKSIVLVKKEFYKAYRSLLTRFPKFEVSLLTLYQLRSSLYDNEWQLVRNFINNLVDLNADLATRRKQLEQIPHPILENDVTYFNPKELHLYASKLPSISSLFYLVLFKYVIENECAFLLKPGDDGLAKMTPELKASIKYLQPYFDIINKITAQLPPGFEFQVYKKHPNIRLYGRLDILTAEGKIIELKFSKQATQVKYAAQVLLYYNNLYPAWDRPFDVEIWNLMNGIKYTLHKEGPITNYSLLKLFCDVTEEKVYDAVFAYDLETNGLIDRGPGGAIACPAIIERYFEEIFLGFSPSNGLIKCDRLTKMTSSITHITSEMLNNGDNGYTRLKCEMDEIDKYFEFPIMIAHNGSQFDHIIMRNAGLFSEGFICLDSRPIIRLRYPQQDLMTERLGEIYKLIIGHDSEVKHRAHADVKMMIEIFCKLNISQDEFVQLREKGQNT